MNWDNVEMIRNAQSSAQKRFDAEHIATQETIEKAMQSEAFKELSIPRMTELESMIFKMRSELIDYIVAHGLVDGLIFNGVLRPVENGKIVISGDMISEITEVLGYYKKDDVERLLGEYLPAHDYVTDADYTHTDNNYTDADVEKVDGIETGAEVNKIIDLVFNGVSVLDDGTRVATITITPEDIKRWYESNANTNAYTDAEKNKLAGISDGAEVNRVDDVLVAGRSVMDGNKKANVTAEIVKAAYESNDNTNAYTDTEKENLAQLVSWKPTAETDIKANAASIETIAGSVSELGDEVNSVAGRVSTLENQKLTVLTIKDSALKDLRAADEDLDGRQAGMLTFTALFKDAAGHQRTVKEISISGFVSVATGYLYIGDMFSVYKNAGTSGLYAAAYHMDDELDPSLQFYWDASKDPGFIPTSVTCSDYAFSAGGLVTGAKIDGTELPQDGGIINLTNITKWIPYEGAGAAPDLNGNLIRNVATPLIDTDVATKKYVDDAKQDLSGLVPYTGAQHDVVLAGYEMTTGAVNTPEDALLGQLRLDNTGITWTSGDRSKTALLQLDKNGGSVAFDGEGFAPFFVGTPTSNYHAATKAYVDEKAGGGAGIVAATTGAEIDFVELTVTADLTITTAQTLKQYDVINSTWSSNLADQFTLKAGRKYIGRRNDVYGARHFRVPVSQTLDIYIEFPADSVTPSSKGIVIGRPVYASQGNYYYFYAPNKYIKFSDPADPFTSITLAAWHFVRG